MPSVRSAILVGTTLLCALPWLAGRSEDQSLTSFALSMPGGSGCMLAHCPLVASKCMLDAQCRKTALCNAGCANKPNVLACDLLCELDSGYNSAAYRAMIKCMNENHCLPVIPGSDGKCLAAVPSEAGKALTSMDQMVGKWYIFRGMNCGQDGWPAGFDAFPCQRDEFVKQPDGKWIDHIAYCGGNVSETQECQTEIVNTQASVYISQPGVMTHNYTDAPLLPQNEEWRVLSWPDHGDWMLYIYCGYTPTGAYAGGSVVSRSAARKNTEIPAKYVTEFREVAAKYGFNYDDMCVSDLSNCKD